MANLPDKAQVSIAMNRLAPYQEEFQKDIFRTTRELADAPVMTPQQQVAGFDPLQQAALTAGQEQILGVRDPETGQLLQAGTGIGGYQHCCKKRFLVLALLLVRLSCRRHV